MPMLPTLKQPIETYICTTETNCRITEKQTESPRPRPAQAPHDAQKPKSPEPCLPPLATPRPSHNPSEAPSTNITRTLGFCTGNHPYGLGQVLLICGLGSLGPQNLLPARIPDQHLSTSQVRHVGSMSVSGTSKTMRRGEPGISTVQNRQL